MITEMKKNYFLLFLWLLASLSGKAQNVWKNVQIGGGGFVSGIITSKNDADLKYARTDVGGAYRWDAANKKWISLLDWLSIDQVGYFGIESLAIDPQNNNVVYLLAGTSYFNNGKTAILKSTNKGNTFTEIEVTSQFKAHGNGMGRSNGERLAVDPNNSNIIYCGTRNNGIFQSIDAGLTWNKLSGFPVTTTSNENGVCFVVLDPASVSGSKTQTIYAGVSQIGASNLYKSLDGGISWTAVSGATTSYMPQRAVLDSNRSLLITYADLEGPWNGTQGKISKLSSTGIFTDITPAGITRPFGGIDVDPANPQRLIASTTNTWSFQYTTPGGTAVYGDHFYISTDGGTNWRDLVGNSGFSFETNGCTWVAGQSIHWATDFKFNPANTSQASIVSGNGLFTCDDINAVKTTWKFDAIGIEESVPLDLISIPSGPLMSVIGDFDGFKHTDVTVFAPQHAPTMGTSTSISYAAGNTNKIVRLGEFMYYSGNQGATWTRTTAALMGQKGRAALSYDGNTILHCPAGATSIYRSVNNGTTWTTCNGISVSDAIPVSDQVTNNKFYVYDQLTGLMMSSTDGGANFVSAGNAGSSGSKLIRTVPGNAGHIWIAMNGGGLKRSIDGGMTFVVPSANVTAASAVGIGKAAPGKTYPSIYIWGTVNGVTGVFRSIDEGVTWLRVNDDAYEFGGTGNGNFVIGDMNTFGRVYMSTVGRGIVYTDKDTNLGISDNEFKNDTQIFSVKAHPNPMEDYVVLELPDYTNGTLVNIQVYDLLGKLIKKDMYTVSNNTVTLFSDDLSNQHGILLVKVKTSNGKSGIVKIIK